MKRKLASIQKIVDINPIENADAIVRATVMGWNVVTKKDEFKPGDLCVFFEIDAVLPEGEEWAEFLRDRNFRVKTCKLRGCLSQGLALPITILPLGDCYVVGEDVTEVLKVSKYEPPEPVSVDVEGEIPGYVPKTDETRAQSAPKVLEELKGHPFYITLKYDGCSVSFAKLDGDFSISGRKARIKKDSNNHYTQAARKLNIEEILPEGFSLQGELCGPGVERNRLKLSDYEVFFFNVLDLKNGKYVDYPESFEFIRNLGLKPVEVLYEGDDESLLDMDRLLELAKGNYDGTKNRREGIVIRSQKNLFSESLGGRMSFKVLNNEFLLKEEK